LQIELAGGGLEDLERFARHFRTGTVAANDCDVVGFHGRAVSPVERRLAIVAAKRSATQGRHPFQNASHACWSCMCDQISTTLPFAKRQTTHTRWSRRLPARSAWKVSKVTTKVSSPPAETNSTRGGASNAAAAAAIRLKIPLRPL